MPDIFQPREGDQVEERKKKLRPIGRRTTKEQILNVFTPNSAIQTPAKFVGRQEALSAMITGLLTTGADLIVYGERGCGKSSLAHMLHHVASGNLELLDYYGIRRDLEEDGLLAWLMGPKRKKFRVIWTDGFGRPVDDVLRQALNRRREGSYGAGIMAYLPTEADQMEVSQKIGFDRIFKSESHGWFDALTKYEAPNWLKFARKYSEYLVPLAEYSMAAFMLWLTLRVVEVRLSDAGSDGLLLSQVLLVSTSILFVSYRFGRFIGQKLQEAVTFVRDLGYIALNRGDEKEIISAQKANRRTLLKGAAAIAVEFGIAVAAHFTALALSH